MTYPTDQYAGQFNIGSMTDDPSQLPAYIAQAMQDYQTGIPSRSALPSYLAVAMSNPQPASSTPLAQAMAGQQANPTPITEAMSPPANTWTLNRSPAGPTDGMGPQAIQGMFENQATNPNLALDSGLIAAGSALMGGDNFQKGLAAAGPAFTNTFNQTLGQQRDLNTPKVTPLADGAFSMVQLPGQQPQVVPNSQVANFTLGRAALQNQWALNKAVVTQNLKSQAQQAQNDRQQAAAYGPKLQMTNQAIYTTQQALQEAQRQAQANPTTSKIAGLFPGVANFFGSDSAQGNNVIQNALVDTQLAQDALKSGAITDQQARSLGADVPGITSSRSAVLIPFLQRRLEALQRYQAFQQSQVSKGNPPPPTGFASEGTSNTVSNGGVLTSNGGINGPVRGNGLSYLQ